MGRNMGRTNGMARMRNRLSDVAVRARKRPGYVADGGNLYLRVAPGGTKGWIFRFTMIGKTRDAGMGSYPTVSLVKAREEAERCRQLVAAGVDPIQARNEQRQAARIAAARAMTFEQCALAFVKGYEAGWRGARTGALFRSAFKAHVFPVIGALPVQVIDTPLVMKVLEPIWRAKPATANRLRASIERVLDWAKVQGLREGQNPAQWRGHLDHLLPGRSKVRRVRHHAALAYREVPAFMEALRAREGPSPRALELMILTATRISETLGALWNEIDLKQRTWTIPAERMKGGKEHRIPLAPRAVAILEEMATIRINEFVFFGAKQGRPLSNTGIRVLMRELRPGITKHGFRSSFRDWAAETTGFQNHVVEMALAHAVSDAVEAAYRRGDLFKKRRKLMDDWATYCERKLASAEVVPLQRRVK
jgi:integrase